MIVSPKCELRIGKEKVENQNADNRRNQAATPNCLNSIPIQLAKIKIATFFKRSDTENTLLLFLLAFFARYAAFLPLASGMICTSKFGAFAISFSVRVGLENMLFRVEELLPITILKHPKVLQIR